MVKAGVEYGWFSVLRIEKQLHTQGSHAFLSVFPRKTSCLGWPCSWSLVSSPRGVLFAVLFFLAPYLALTSKVGTKVFAGVYFRTEGVENVPRPLLGTWRHVSSITLTVTIKGWHQTSYWDNRQHHIVAKVRNDFHSQKYWFFFQKFYLGKGISVEFWK